jgi:asparagine synthase (glutamine-hydrolysing)
MCGITGIFDLEGKASITEDTISAMCDSIYYRGPDDSGVAVGEGYGLGSRRLAIIDISPMGHMPMTSDDGRYIIVYNGEVYNFKDIRNELEKEGIEFNSGTDTEVILKSYIFYGSRCLPMFNGMFAFAIYDTVKKKLFIARDRLGVKPLYYSIFNNKVYFGSEFKTLWAAGVPKKFNHSKFGELLSFRYVAGEETIYENVKKLLPGHYMELSGNNISFTSWWKLKDFALNESKRPQGDVEDWYRETFDDSIRLRKISDVPVGVLLSGGLDSSSVAASLATNSKQQLSSFTVRFKEGKYDEGKLAKILADKYHLDFNDLFLDPEKIFDITIDLLKGNDEPIFHASDLFVKEISSLAKSKVTVLLSGEGGDETLGGYVRYNPLRFSKLLKLSFALRPFLNMLPVKQSRIAKLIRMLSLRTVDNFIMYNSSEILPEDLKRIGFINSGNHNYRKAVLWDAKKAYPDDPLRQVMYYDMQTFLCSLLDRNDLMTMRSSIECRVPFLDYRLVEGLASLPASEIFKNKEVKGLLRSALGNRLPPEILNAKKWGFAVPWMKYYRENPKYRDYLSSLSGHELINIHFNDASIIDDLIKKFLNGDDSNFPIINQLTNICLWYDISFNRFPQEKQADQKHKTLFYVGNFLAKHGKNANFNVFLIPRLQEYFKVIFTSDKKLKILRLLDMATMLYKRHKEIDIVIIDVYSTDAFWYALILAGMSKFFKIPYVNILHGGNLPKRIMENKRMSSFLFTNAFRNVSPSIFLKEVFSKEGYQTDYLPNFVEIDAYKFKERNSIKCNIFWLRAFHKIYNPVLAVRILKVLVDRGIDANLCMVGPDKDGSKDDVLAEAKRLKVNDRLTIPGLLNRDEWTKLSENYDIFLNTSNIDNHPVSVIEAMALGFPIVSTNIGGLSYLIENEVDGILNPANNEVAFADSIQVLLNDPGKVNKISSNARAKAEVFTWKELREKWLNVLNNN